MTYKEYLSTCKQAHKANKATREVARLYKRQDPRRINMARLIVARRATMAWAFNQLMRG